MLLMFLAGLFLGIAVTLLFFYICFLMRWLFFAYVPVYIPICDPADYYDTPHEAVRAGYKLEDITYVKDGKLYYTPIARSQGCAPVLESRIVEAPPFCVINGEYAELVDQEARIYRTSDGRQVTARRCMPESGNGYATLG